MKPKRCRNFWHVGRAASMSPLKTAKAFNAPLLRSHDSNASIDNLLTDVGERPVRYGAISVAEPMNAFDNSPQVSGRDSSSRTTVA